MLVKIIGDLPSRVVELDQAILHILLGLGDQLQSPFIEFLKQLFADILADEVMGHLRHRLTVVRVGRGELEGKQFPFVVDNQMELLGEAFPEGSQNATRPRFCPTSPVL